MWNSNGTWVESITYLNHLSNFYTFLPVIQSVERGSTSDMKERKQKEYIVSHIWISSSGLYSLH